MGHGINTEDRSTTRVTRLKLASASIAVLVTAGCVPPAPAARAVATVEHGMVEAYQALQVVYAVATADR